MRELVESKRPQVVLLEVRLPGASGYEICRQLRDEFGEGLPIVFLSGEKKDELDRVAGLLVGADDYLTKPVVTDVLLARVRRFVAQAGVPSEAELTDRQREILSLLAAGSTRAEIASALVISRKTVAKHIEHILQKLQVHSESQAVAKALRAGIVETPGLRLATPADSSGEDASAREVS